MEFPWPFFNVLLRFNFQFCGRCPQNLNNHTNGFVSSQQIPIFDLPNMKRLIILPLIILSFASTFGQSIVPGDYGDGFTLAYDSTTKKLTGYYENYTGYDEHTGNPRFSCVFYIEGTVTGKKIQVQTYSPTDKKDDLIQGAFEIVTNRRVQIKLPQEHGGCWNVEHFADSSVEFALEKEQPWIQIRYVNAAKANFYSDKSEDKRLKAYILKGDVVYVEKIEQEWAYCTYNGKKVTKGWLKVAELNKL